MSIEQLRMCVCDDCGAMEMMPNPEASDGEIVMAVAPKDWMAAFGSEEVKAYCPACKFLHSGEKEGQDK
jgi:hypothetical protein